MKDYLDTNQLASEFKVSRQTIFNWRKEGMPYHRLNHMIRFDLGEVVDWLQKKGVENVGVDESNRH